MKVVTCLLGCVSCEFIAHSLRIFQATTLCMCLPFLLSQVIARDFPSAYVAYVPTIDFVLGELIAQPRFFER